jgi:hypothetical protein
MINVNDKPVTYGVLRQWLETLLDKPTDTSTNNGSRTESLGANDSNRVNGRNHATQLASASNSESSVQVESVYKPDEKLLGQEAARAVQFLPKNIIQELERKVREKNINPQSIEEFQIDLDRHVRVDAGALSKEAAKNGLGISPLTLLGDPNKETHNALKIKQEDLNKTAKIPKENLKEIVGILARFRY